MITAIESLRRHRPIITGSALPVVVAAVIGVTALAAILLGALAVIYGPATEASMGIGICVAIGGWLFLVFGWLPTTKVLGCFPLEQSDREQVSNYVQAHPETAEHVSRWIMLRGGALCGRDIEALRRYVAAQDYAREEKALAETVACIATGSLPR